MTKQKVSVKQPRARGQVKIEKHIPIPPRVRGSGRIAKYPWEIMAVGDSFLMETPSGRTGCSLNRKRCPDRKFTQRKTKEGTRVWRIK